MTRVVAALAGGCALGLTAFALGMWAFANGHPIFDTIRDSDTIHHI